MATPTKLPRGIRLTTYPTKDGLVTKYRVEITRKDWQGKRNNLFDTLNEAKAFLLLSKNKKGQEFIYQTEEKQKPINQDWADKDFSFGYFAKIYLENCVFNQVADTELKRRNQAMKKAFINKICNISIPNRYLTPQDKLDMGLEADSVVYSFFSSFDVRTQIRRIDINNYIKTRLNGDSKNRAVKPISVARELTFISNVFSYLIDIDESLEYIKNPIRGGDYDKSLLRNVINARRRTLKEEEEEKFFEVIKNYKSHKPKHRGQLYSICMLSLLTSMRKSEIVFLRKDQIKDDFRIIHLTITKSGKSRDVYLDETAREFLKNLEPMGENGRYFTYSNYGFSRVFTSLMRQNDLGDLHFHDLRRTKISRMLSLGGQDNTILIAKLLGFQSNRKFESIHVNKNQGLGSQSSMLASFGHDKEVNFKHYANPDLTVINKLEKIKSLKEKKQNGSITEEEDKELFDLLLQLTE
ncbi:TPA: site-specific integrase [Burkholderia vietnamiensis]|nr:site-specific integrase [Burkholderia vietnamiensis]